ncbi:uncharacterized protein LOC129614989 [Condylostylus longicornis]|uniref:uncharacterized protein LOC129614989 n=1 Tax=Condylostylus longicornis TaxID=2530218 RepID=UPI00244E08B6|nr:uncharacterized protein LOC129614989 [Condylostylus longicornis]
MIRLLRNTKSTYFSRCISTTAQNHGYIVLVPEIGEDDNFSQTLIDEKGLLRFNGLTIENCLAAVSKQAKDVEMTVKSIETKITLAENDEKIDLKEEIFKKLDEKIGPLETTWGIAKAIYLGNSTLMPTKSYMSVHERARSARAAKFSNDVIFKEIKSQYEILKIDDSEYKRLIQKFLLEGKLNGLDLQESDRIQLEDISLKLGQERASYKNKVNSVVSGFSHLIKDYSLVRDFPPNVLEAIAVDHNKPTNGPWKISLQPYIVKQFLKYCPDRIQRWNIWQADIRKCSQLAEKNFETSTHLEKIRGLRKRQAEVLGYKTFADMSMQTKMIKTVDNAKDLFAKLLNYAGPLQQAEVQTLQDFANNSGFERKLEPYDIFYWQRKFLKSNFNLDENNVSEYFTPPSVFAGMFEIAEIAFNIKILEKEVEVWHPGVKFYEVFDLNRTVSDPVGGFYLDCYSKERNHNRNFGWMVGIRNRNVQLGQNPLAALIFNFSSPVYNKPHLLTMEDLEMIFRNFGSLLQHILTRANYVDLAGLSNIEWDASQICGHVLCNFLNDDKILKKLSSHYANEEQIPDDIAKNIKLFKTSMSAYELCKELYLCDLDLELHSKTEFWLDIVKKLWPVYHIMPLEKIDAHPCSMSNIFSGDWGAAYFSNLHSRLIAADIYDAFEEKSKGGDAGVRFKETFLSLGGSIKTEEIFRRFRGRDPTSEALLRSLNLLGASQTSYC